MKKRMMASLLVAVMIITMVQSTVLADSNESMKLLMGSEETTDSRDYDAASPSEIDREETTDFCDDDVSSPSDIEEIEPFAEVNYEVSTDDELITALNKIQASEDT